ncbi:hypothetical protein HOLleu_15986 [Holothuria leucospilota]|uniref:Uncharacterized protein n=1 Tax=Holothuria leucospilota TaxID=206669 RepID=A0A9Q1HAB4_HOLLE|nr:hypothetical protein HOLleu_15986 [Holothuria leucospilota]
MLFLHIVYVSCLLAHIQLGQAAIVESSETGMEGSSNQIEIQLEKFQQRLIKIEETQQLQLEFALQPPFSLENVLTQAQVFSLFVKVLAS